VAAHLVTAEVPGRTTAERTHQTAIAFLLRVGVCGAVATGLVSLAVGIRVVGVIGRLALRVSALLGELVRRLSSRVLLVSLVLLLVGVLIGRWALLAVLEAALGWRSVPYLLLLRIRIWISLAGVGAVLWRDWRVRWVTRGIRIIVVSWLRCGIALASRSGRAILVGRVLLVVLAAVLVVWIRHGDGGEEKVRCGVRCCFRGIPERTSLMWLRGKVGLMREVVLKKDGSTMGLDGLMEWRWRRLGALYAPPPVQRLTLMTEENVGLRRSALVKLNSAPPTDYELLPNFGCDERP